MNDDSIVAIANFCGRTNDNVKCLLVSSEEGIAALIKNHQTKTMKKMSKSSEALYKQYFIMIEQGRSLRQHDQQRLILNKSAEYELNEHGVAKLSRRQKLSEDVAYEFACAQSKEFTVVYGHVLNISLYRLRSYIIRNVKRTDSDELSLILHKDLVETTKEIYYRLLHHPAFQGAINHPHVLKYKDYFDEMLGVNIESEVTVRPIMDNYGVSQDGNGNVFIKCREVQLLSFGQDAKGNNIGLPTKKMYHGSLQPLSAMKAGAIQLSNKHLFT